MIIPIELNAEFATWIGAITGAGSLFVAVRKLSKKPVGEILHPCHILQAGNPYPDCYLCGPDGCDLAVCGRGRCSLPESWRDKRVQVYSKGTDSLLHVFLFLPVPDGILIVEIP